LEGAINILKARKNIDFIALYTGKLSLDDLSKVEKKVKKESILMPVFMADMDSYNKALDIIAKWNHID